MARVIGLEKNQTPWHLRWFYGVMRKMFDKDLTPAKIQMRLPGLVSGGIQISPTTFYARLQNQFSEEQLMQLSGHIAFENYRARWNRVFGVESDDVYRSDV